MRPPFDLPTVDRDALGRVLTGPGNPGKSLNFKKSFSQPGKSWNSAKCPGKSWKSELGYIL